MSQQINSTFRGEESQIRELLNMFQVTILKTGHDTLLLESKFDSDLKQKLKPKLTKYMKNLVEMDQRLSNEKEAASEANNDINAAYRAYSDPTTLASEDEDPLPEEPVEFDDNGEPVYHWPPASWGNTTTGQNYLRILEDDNFDIFFDHLIKIKDGQPKNKSDPRVKSLKNLLAQKENNNDDIEDEDDEPIASEVESIPIDPITKKKIRVPVKNVKCGHIYDKDSIASYMKSTNPRCPYIGCVNRAPIRPDDVVNDEETRQKIEYLMALENNESDDE